MRVHNVAESLFFSYLPLLRYPRLLYIHVLESVSENHECVILPLGIVPARCRVLRLKHHTGLFKISLAYIGAALLAPAVLAPLFVVPVLGFLSLSIISPVMGKNACHTSLHHSHALFFVRALNGRLVRNPHPILDWKHRSR